MEIILLFTLKNARLQNLKLIFLVILRIYDLECHGQTSVNVDLIMFGVVFMKFKKPLPRKQTNMDLRKTSIFSLFRSFPILWASSIQQKEFSKS